MCLCMPVYVLCASYMKKYSCCCYEFSYSLLLYFLSIGTSHISIG